LALVEWMKLESVELRFSNIEFQSDFFLIRIV